MTSTLKMAIIYTGNNIAISVSAYVTRPVKTGHVST